MANFSNSEQPVEGGVQLRRAGSPENVRASPGHGIASSPTHRILPANPIIDALSSRTLSVRFDLVRQGVPASPPG